MHIREIARELGCSRNTVKRYLRDRKASRYGPRQPRGTKLDPFKDYLRERIEAAKPSRARLALSRHRRSLLIDNE